MATWVALRETPSISGGLTLAIIINGKSLLGVSSVVLNVVIAGLPEGFAPIPFIPTTPTSVLLNREASPS